MKKIALLSDTHSFLDDQIIKHLKDADEIWHAGDIGDTNVADKLNKINPLKAVFGNIDGAELRKMYPKDLFFRCEDMKVYLTHIGGYPNHYEKRVKAIIQKVKPDLFICGHSHICKVMKDERNNLLHINPGAAGNKGFHHISTLVKMQIHKGKINSLEVVELGSRSRLS